MTSKLILSLSFRIISNPLLLHQEQDLPTILESKSKVIPMELEVMSTRFPPEDPYQVAILQMEPLLKEPPFHPKLGPQ